jgi:hypothetical protein
VTEEKTKFGFNRLGYLGVTVPYWSFGETIPVPTVARFHFLSPKL